MNLANKLTMLRIVLIPLFMILALADYPFGRFWAAVVFVLAAATDGLDGYVARKRKEITNLGKLLDPLADKLLVAAALITMTQVGRIPSWITFAIIGREFLVTGLRGIASAEGLIIPASKLGKIKTVIQIVALTTVLLDDYVPLIVEHVPIFWIFRAEFFFQEGRFLPGVWLLYAAVAFTLYSGLDYLIKTFAKIKMQ